MVDVHNTDREFQMDHAEAEKTREEKLRVMPDVLARRFMLETKQLGIADFDPLCTTDNEYFQSLSLSKFWLRSRLLLYACHVLLLLRNAQYTP